MISKKDALTLGILAIGGIGVASVIADSGAGGLTPPSPRPGGILGSAGKDDVYNYIYNIPASGEVVFPEAPKFDFSKFFITPEPSRGAAGVSSAGKQITAAHKKVVAGGFDVSTTFTGTPTTPSFVQKDIYHKEMLTELGLTTPKKVTAGTFASESYQKGYQERATERHTAARKERMSKKENK